MNLSDKGIETIEKHNAYLDALTTHITASTKHLVDDVQSQKQNNYKNLVLVLGYTVYFTTWFQLRDFFPKLPMKISYGFMIVSLATTVLTLMGTYLMSLIKNKQRAISQGIWWSDVLALISGFISFGAILISAICWVF